MLCDGRPRACRDEGRSGRDVEGAGAVAARPDDVHSVYPREVYLHAGALHRPCRARKGVGSDGSPREGGQEGGQLRLPDLARHHGGEEPLALLFAGRHAVEGAHEDRAADRLRRALADAPPGGEFDDVRQLPRALGRAYGLRVVLDAFYRKRLVSKSHDLAVLAFGGDLEAVGKRLALDGKGMVAHGDEPLVESGEEAASVMPQAARLAVHEPFCADDPRTEGLGDRLVAQAYPDERHLPRERLDGLQRHACGVGVPGAGREEYGLRRLRGDARDVDFVVADDLDLRSKRPQSLYYVVGEGIVVVYYKYHSGSPRLQFKITVPPRT